MSIAFVGLIVVSIFSFFQNRKLALTNRLFILPIALFFSLAISLFYSNDFTKGLDILLSQIDFLAIPFIFWVNQSFITKRFQYYIRLLINATSIASFITFIFFLFPVDLTKYIAANIPLLKDYIVHEKALAFGVYSPFTERLQFSYLIGVAIFLQLWLVFEGFVSIDKSSPRPPPEAGLLSSILRILTGLFLHKIRGFARYFSPFEGGWGDVKSGFSRIIGINTKNIPLAPFKRGNCILQTKISGKNFNIYTLVKQNLTALPPEGEKDRANLHLSNYLQSLLKIITLFITLLILGARGAQLGFLGASIIWIIGGYFYFIYPRLVKKMNIFFAYAFLLVGLTFFLIIAPFFAYKKIPAVKIRYDQMHWEIGTFQDGTFKNYEYIHFTSIRRLLSWKNSWVVIQENPILGVGIGDYQAAMKKEYAKDNLGFPVNTQSQFLYYWTAAGLISLLIFISLLGYTLFVFFRQQDFALKLLGCSFIVFYSLIFLFDAPLNFQVGAMTFLTIYCLLATKIHLQSHDLIHS